MTDRKAETMTIEVARQRQQWVVRTVRRQGQMRITEDYAVRDTKHEADEKAEQLGRTIGEKR